MNSSFFKIIAIIFILWANIAESQIIAGHVYDNSNNPIAYTSIGVVGTRIGAISNDQGYFELNIVNAEKFDTIRFSSLGYHTVNKPVSEIQTTESIVIILLQKSYVIKEIMIKPSTFKQTIFGSRIAHNNSWTISMLNRGVTFAQLINNNSKIKLKQFSIHVKSLAYDSVLVRLNFFEELDGKPGKYLNNKELFFVVKENGWMSKNLENQNIYYDRKFFVSVEPVGGWHNSNEKQIGEISFSCKNRGSFFQRNASFSEWTKFDDTLDIYIKVDELTN